MKYICPNCKYVQDFEPTEESMIIHFGTPDTKCPSCHKVELEKVELEEEKE